VIIACTKPRQLFVVTDGSKSHQIFDFCRNRSLKTPLHLIVKIDATPPVSARSSDSLASGVVDRRDHVLSTLQQLQFGFDAWNVTFSCIWGASIAQNVDDWDALGLAIDPRSNELMDGGEKWAVVTRSAIERRCFLKGQGDGADRGWPMAAFWKRLPLGPYLRETKLAPSSSGCSNGGNAAGCIDGHVETLLLHQNGDFWDVSIPKGRYIGNLRDVSLIPA
jgi:hypothetical protein